MTDSVTPRRVNQRRLNPRRANPVVRASSLAVVVLLAMGAAVHLASAQADSVAIETLTITRKTDYISVTLHLPVFTGLGDEAAQRELNRAIRQKALAFAADLMKQAREAKDDEYFHAYEAFVEYEVHHLSDRTVSLLLSYYQYTGGAHGLTTIEGLTVDATSGKTLALRDLFQPGTDYRSIIAAEIGRQFDERQGDFFPDARATALDFNENQFYLDGDNIVIFFQQYDIAPYAAGHPKFQIPVAPDGTSITCSARPHR